VISLNDYIGDENTRYEITLPDGKECNDPVYLFSRHFYCAPYYYRNVSVTIDHQKILNSIPDLRIELPQNSNNVGTFFMVNNHIFMMIVSDTPTVQWETWMPPYAEKCSAFFILQLRSNLQHIFESCPIPIYPLLHPEGYGIVCNRRLIHGSFSGSIFEYYHSLGLEKTIPIFFHGRYKTRISRRGVARVLRRNIPSAYITFTEWTPLATEEYVRMMAQAKIAWCPKSVKCPHAGAESNGLTGKEIEAMCLETMILKPPTHIIESEERKSGIHFVTTDTFSSDIVAKVQYYLDHDDERKEIARNGRLYWERNLSPWARTNFMLTKCIEAMEKK
jgi:hypothetical protein